MIVKICRQIIWKKTGKSADISKPSVERDGLTAELITKHLPKSEATIKGHLDHQRQNIRSTQRYPEPTTTQTVEPPPPPTGFTSLHPHYTYLTIVDCKGEIATDQTGAFPIRWDAGNQYIMVLYCYDANAILVEPLKTRKGGDILNAYQKLTNRLTRKGFRPRIQRLDNEASNEMKRHLNIQAVDFQLPPPYNHRRNAAERAIRTFKNHFIAILCATDAEFPLCKWCTLLPQAEITLNLLRSSRINPKLSAWAQLEGHLNRVR